MIPIFSTLRVYFLIWWVFVHFFLQFYKEKPLKILFRQIFMKYQVSTYGNFVSHLTKNNSIKTPKYIFENWCLHNLLKHVIFIFRLGWKKNYTCYLLIKKYTCNFQCDFKIHSISVHKKGILFLLNTDKNKKKKM